MSRYVLPEHAREKARNAIVLTGIARSGTSILGKVIHSFKDVEFAYEPPVLVSLFATIGELSEYQWKFLYETYLYEDLLINSLAGRSVNCNRADDSSIYLAKPRALVESRLARSLRKADAEALGRKAQLAYKIPQLGPFLGRFRRYYPRTPIVITTRGAVEVFNSISEKKWFTDESLGPSCPIWPCRIHGNLRVPFWVAEGDADAWCRMDELHRTAYYYIRVSESQQTVKDAIVVRYSDLIGAPERVTRQLAENLGLEWGEMTPAIVSNVGHTEKIRDSNILERLDRATRDKVLHYSNLS